MSLEWKREGGGIKKSYDLKGMSYYVRGDINFYDFKVIDL